MSFLQIKFSMKPVCFCTSVYIKDAVPIVISIGIDLRDNGRVGEAFVFLNHYLDICEAIEEGESQLVDHTDFLQTDFPSNIPLPESIYLQNDPQEHDSVREWVLAISMDQNVEQVGYE